MDFHVTDNEGQEPSADEAPPPGPLPAKMDTAEQVNISSLALLKMLKHARAGVPMEVMGLLVGEFVDEYTVQVVDVFAIPQKGTSVSVESVDEPFQIKMFQMLADTGRHQMSVGWYHSHPGLDVFLSGIDVETHKVLFQNMTPRAIAVVLDPIRSVRGRVVIDAFRCIPNPALASLGLEPRQTTSTLGQLKEPTRIALAYGLNFKYYSININFRLNELERQMLLKLHKQSWMDGLNLKDYRAHSDTNQQALAKLLPLVQEYNQSVQDEDKLTAQQLAIKYVGKEDPKRHLEADVFKLLNSNITQMLGAMLSTDVFEK